MANVFISYSQAAKECAHSLAEEVVLPDPELEDLIAYLRHIGMRRD